MRLSEFDSVIVAPLDQNLNLEVWGCALFLRKHFVHFNRSSLTNICTKGTSQPRAREDMCAFKKCVLVCARSRLACTLVRACVLGGRPAHTGGRAHCAHRACAHWPPAHWPLGRPAPPAAGDCPRTSHAAAAPAAYSFSDAQLLIGPGWWLTQYRMWLSLFTFEVKVLFHKSSWSLDQICMQTKV